jgi:hyperosmotically inducible protein
MGGNPLAPILASFEPERRQGTSRRSLRFRVMPADGIPVFGQNVYQTSRRRLLRIGNRALNAPERRHAQFTFALLSCSPRKPLDSGARLSRHGTESHSHQEIAMRSTTTFRKTLFAAGLIAAFAAMPIAQVSAQATQSDNQTVPDKAADTWITTKVKSEFATTKHLKASDISVSTNDGVVTLSGSVASEKQKTRAENIAKGVKGVKSVDTSGLTVGSSSK